MSSLREDKAALSQTSGSTALSASVTLFRMAFDSSPNSLLQTSRQAAPVLQRAYPCLSTRYKAMVVLPLPDLPDSAILLATSHPENKDMDNGALYNNCSNSEIDTFLFCATRAINRDFSSS